MASETLPLEPTLVLQGETFRVEREEGHIYIGHSRWSLVGAGASLVEAVRDLLGEMHEIRDVYERRSNLSTDAAYMLAWLRSCLGPREDRNLPTPSSLDREIL